MALLRGINVGGHRKLPMAALVELFAEAGCQNVRTYIQSGNVVFQAPEAAVAGLSARISGLITARFGFEVPVVLRTAQELSAIVRDCPYPDAEPKLLHVAYLLEAPAPGRVATLDPDRSPPDSFVARERELYVHYANGAGQTKLTNDYIERVLGTTSTMRNWQTTLKLLEMAKAEQ